jgi:hypothetical protein
MASKELTTVIRQTRAGDRRGARAPAACFMLHDKDGGYYVVVGRTPDAVVATATPKPMTPYLVGNDWAIPWQ